MSDEFTKEEAEQRARAVARRMLNTLPQPRTKPKAAAKAVRTPGAKPSARKKSAG